MQYLGGKKRIASQLAAFMLPYLKGKSYYFEPFVGSAAVIEKFSGKRIANDKNQYLIALYKALQVGWIPPKTLSELEYQHIKNNLNENLALTGFAGIGCSFSGKWFGGYSRSKDGRNYALNAHNTLLKQLPYIKDVLFRCKDYSEYCPENSLVYCDPPYSNTTKYDLFDGFDHKTFWEVVREWSKNNTVFISEYSAPQDFKCVLTIETRTDLKDTSGKMIPRTERLFQYDNTK